MKPLDKVVCPRCHPDHTLFRHKPDKYQCKDCKKKGRKSYFTYPEKENEPVGETQEIEYKGDHINVVCVSEQVLTEEQLAERFKIDTSKWELDSFKVKITWGYRKDRKSSWKYDQSGHVAPGSFVEDSGKMLLVPMYNIHASYIKKVDEILARDIIRDMIEDAKGYAPKYPVISRDKSRKAAGYDAGYLYEIDLADLHFGKLAWAQETGEDYDIQIAATAARNAFSELLSFVGHLPVGKILLPLGNDFFNVNGAGEFTMSGTRQIEDTRWQKTFREGRKLLVELIDMAVKIAPVDVLIVPGNHDRDRMFYAGDALECWYHGNPGVLVDNGAKLRKYYTFGKNLTGFTHGSEKGLFGMGRCLSSHAE